MSKRDANIYTVINSALFIKDAAGFTPEQLIGSILYEKVAVKLKGYMNNIRNTKTDDKAHLFISGDLTQHADDYDQNKASTLDRLFLGFLDYNKSPQQRLIIALSKINLINIKRNDHPLAIFIHQPKPKQTNPDAQTIEMTLLFKKELITLAWDKSELESKRWMTDNADDESYIIGEMLKSDHMIISTKLDERRQKLIAMIRTLVGCSEKNELANTELNKNLHGYLEYVSEHGSHRIRAIGFLAASSAAALTGIILVPCVATIFAASLLAAGASGITAAIAAILLIAAGAVGVVLSTKAFKHSKTMQLGSQSILALKPQEPNLSRKPKVVDLLQSDSRPDQYPD